MFLSQKYVYRSSASPSWILRPALFRREWNAIISPAKKPTACVCGFICVMRAHTSNQRRARSISARRLSSALHRFTSFHLRALHLYWNVTVSCYCAVMVVILLLYRCCCSPYCVVVCFASWFPPGCFRFSLYLCASVCRMSLSLCARVTVLSSSLASPPAPPPLPARRLSISLRSSGAGSGPENFFSRDTPSSSGDLNASCEGSLEGRSKFVASVVSIHLDPRIAEDPWPSKCEVAQSISRGSAVASRNAFLFPEESEEWREWRRREGRGSRR